MGTFGKVLLFVNLLAAAGVTYFATQDWARRQEIQTSALHHYVTLQGLPQDEPKDKDKVRTPDSIPFEVPMSGGYVTSSVRKEFLERYLGGADGGPNFGNRNPQPASQMEEVKAVQAKCNQMLTGNEAEQLAVLCGKFGPAQGNQPRPFTAGWLVGMAENFEVRDYIRGLADTPNVKPGEVSEAVKVARDMLNKRFQAVLSEPNPKLADEEAAALKTASENLRTAAAASQQALLALQQVQGQNPPPPANAPQLVAARKAAEEALKAEAEAFAALRRALTDLGTAASRDAGDRQKRTAHLLMHLDPTPNWQKRVALVVGLRTYVLAVGEHVTRMRNMQVAAEQQIVSDQASFSEEYQLLSNLAAQRAVLLYQQQKVTADLRSQRAIDRAAVNARTAQLISHRAELAKLQAEVQATLAKQAEVEQRLFDVERRVGQTLDRNGGLEKKLDETERAKAGKGGP